MVPAKKGRQRYEAIVWKPYLNILKINKGLVPAQVNREVGNGRVEEVVGRTVTAI